MRDDLIEVARRVSVLAVAIMLLTPAGMGMVTASADDGAVSSVSTDDGSVSSVRTVDEIRGHLSVAADHLAEDRRDNAVAHTENVLDEQWPILATELSGVNETLANQLESELQRAQTAASNESASAFETLIREDVDPLLDRAERSVVTETQATNTTFNAQVVAGLLERSGAEYQEGVTESGEVTEDMDYWAASAFAAQAEERYEDHIRSGLSEHAAEELDEMFATLRTRMDERAAPKDVTALTGSITGELGEYTGLEVETSGEGAETIERIEADLHEAVEAYEAGNEAEAKSIIKNTYLSNFEGIEGALIENDPELVEELEADFNERLPGLIDDGAPVSEVRETVESMEEKLHEAEEILVTQDETEIDLGSDNESTTDDAESGETAGESGSEETTGDDGTEEATETTTPGFGVLVALFAVGLIALTRYREQ